MGVNSIRKKTFYLERRRKESLRKQNDTFWFVILLLCEAGKKGFEFEVNPRAFELAGFSS